MALSSRDTDMEETLIRKGIHQDANMIKANMAYKEKEILHKRLYLMGLADAPSLEKEGDLPAGKPDYMPESFLRKDDIFYEEVEKIVEKAFGIDHDYIQQHTHHKFLEFCNVQHMSSVILSLLDDFTNMGIYSLAKVLTGDTITFEKTRTQMEKVIRKSLEVLQSRQWPGNQAKIQSQVSKLLGNRKNFRHDVRHLSATLKSHGDAVMKVLDGLRDMPARTLGAMHRKLKGIQGYMPQLCPPKSGWNRDRLIHQVRTMCLNMIGQLGDSDELPEPLAKAMAVASLSSMLVSSYDDLSLTRFVHVTPEKVALQKEIFQAIQSLSQITKKKKIEKLLLVLDPKSEMGTVGAQAIKNMLIEFLFECSDMDTIPGSLLDALSLVNEKPADRLLSKDTIEEVEEILKLSAAVKQILLDHIPGDKLDEDFADGYMEDLVESDGGDFFYDDDSDDDELLKDRVHGVQIRLNDFNEEVQSTGNPDNSSEDDSSSSSSGVARHFDDDECMDMEISAKGLSTRDTPMLDCEDIKRQDAGNKSVDLVNSAANSHSTTLTLERNPLFEYHKKRRNRYVALQELSDQASLNAYWLMGHLMEDLAKREGLDLSQDDISYLRGGSLRPRDFEDPVVN